MTTPEFTLMIKGTASQLALILSLPELQGVEASPAVIPPAPSLPTASAIPAGPAAAPVGMPAIQPAAPVMPQAAPTPLPVATIPMPLNGGDDDDGPADANAPDVDGTGLRWDERIHSSNHARNADGTWRKRRGVDAALVAQVEAELRAGQAAPPPPMAMPAPMPMPPMAAAPPPVMPAPVAQPAPMAMPAPAPQAAVQQAVEAVTAPGAALDFAGFMQHISAKMQQQDATGAPIIHADYLANVAAEIGTAFNQQLGAITDIAANPQMITYAQQIIARDGRW